MYRACCLLAASALQVESSQALLASLQPRLGGLWGRGGLGKEDELEGQLEVGARMLPPWSWGDGSSEQGRGGHRMDMIAAANTDQCKQEVWGGEARLGLLWYVGQKESWLGGLIYP